MVIGLVGLAAMAVPAFAHSHGALPGHGGAHGIGHAGAAHGMAHATVPSARGALQQLLPADPAHESRWRFLPTPRAVFSLLALYGAFGNAAVHAFRLPLLVAALGALLPALLIEWLLVRRLWNLVFRLEAPACSPLERLILSEARAVVPFRNGRGMVSTVRDGRSVQLVANLSKEHAATPVKVGDRLLIEDVDAIKERVTVSVIPN
jgi:hypothetical protein